MKNNFIDNTHFPPITYSIKEDISKRKIYNMLDCFIYYNGVILEFAYQKNSYSVAAYFYETMFNYIFKKYTKISIS